MHILVEPPLWAGSQTVALPGLTAGALKSGPSPPDTKLWPKVMPLCFLTSSDLEPSPAEIVCSVFVIFPTLG